MSLVIYKCTECSSTDMQSPCWVGMNDGIVDDPYDIEKYFCKRCQKVYDKINTVELSDDLVTTNQQFNKKYKDFIEKGFEDRGLELYSEEAIKYLDKEFMAVIQEHPSFEFSIIKVKFNSVSIFAYNIPKDIISKWEKELTKLINNETSNN
jgi:hypothetical protein